MTLNCVVSEEDVQLRVISNLYGSLALRGVFYFKRGFYCLFQLSFCKSGRLLYNINDNLCYPKHSPAGRGDRRSGG